jgi:hypothetical protein
MLGIFKKILYFLQILHFSNFKKINKFKKFGNITNNYLTVADLFSERVRSNGKTVVDESEESISATSTRKTLTKMISNTTVSFY